MKEQDVYLFIGGSNDGERRHLLDRPAKYRLPVMMHEQFLHITQPVPVSVPYTVETYNLDVIESKDRRRFYFYRHESLSDSEVVEKMLMNYQVSRED